MNTVKLLFMWLMLSTKQINHISVPNQNHNTKSNLNQPSSWSENSSNQTKTTINNT